MEDDATKLMEYHKDELNDIQVNTKKEIEQQKQKIQNLNDEYQIQSEKVDKLTTENMDLQSHVKRIGKQLSEMNNFKQKESEFQSMICNLEQELQGKQQEFDTILCNQETLKDINEELQQDLTYQRTQVCEKDTELKEINDQYEQQQQQLDTKNEKICSQEEVIMSLRKELTALIANKTDINSIITENQELKKKLEITKEEFNNKTNELQKTKVELNNANDKSLQLKSEKNILNNTINELRGAFQNMQLLMSEKEAERNTAIESCEIIHEKLEEEQQQSRHLERDNDALRLEIEQLKEKARECQKIYLIGTKKISEACAERIQRSKAAEMDLRKSIEHLKRKHINQVENWKKKIL